jgi:hypothetical protein
MGPRGNRDVTPAISRFGFNEDRNAARFDRSFGEFGGLRCSVPFGM